MYIRGDHQIFEETIFAKVSLTLLIFNKARAQRGAKRFWTPGESIVLASFVARDNLIGGSEQAHRA